MWLLSIVAIAGVMFGCQASEEQSNTDESMKNEEVQEKGIEEVENTFTTYDFSSGMAIDVIDGENVSMEEFHGQDPTSESSGARLISDTLFKGCEDQHNTRLQLPLKRVGGEPEEWVIPEDCYQDIVAHEYGEFEFDIFKYIGRDETPKDIEEVKETNLVIAESSNTAEGEPFTVTEVDLENHPRLDEVFDYYFTVEGTYGEEGFQNDWLTGREYVIHRLVSVEGNIEYSVRIEYPKDKEDEEQIKALLDMASTLQYDHD